MNDLSDLEQAQRFAQIGDWAHLSHKLQQMLLAKPLPEFPQTEEWQQLLALALLVLEAGDFHARWDIGRVFPAFGETAIAPLIHLLQDGDADLETRWFAARILSNFDCPATVEALILVLQQTEDEDLSLVVAETLANLGVSAIAALSNLLHDHTTRPLAVRALVQIRHPETITPLLGVVDDTDPAMRAITIEAVGSFADPRIPPVLLQALRDPAAVVRRAAIDSLGVRPDLIAECDLVSQLAECLWDLNLEVCQQAAIALGRLGTDTAVTALRQRLQSPGTPLPLQISLVRALGWAGTALALDALHQSLSLLDPAPPYLVYQEAITVLGRWSDPDRKSHATQILTDALDSQHPAITQGSIQQAIALGLGHLEQPEALAPLSRLLATDDMGVRLHAIAALKNLATQNTRQYLEQLATQNDLPAAMREGVAIALQEWGDGSG